MEQARLFSAAQNTLIEPLQSHLERLDPAWAAALLEPRTQAALMKLSSFLGTRLQAGAEIYPRHPFRAFEYLQPDTARVIILGQDPYHGADQAQGLAFSVPDECRCPPSLRNIFKELALEYPDARPRRGNELSAWARQGVLLLNATLTVESGLPASHTRQGWEEVTDALLQAVARTPQPKVFMLWGAHAQSKQKLLGSTSGGPVCVLTSNHPSPLSALRPPKPFMGCGHFTQANEWLQTQGQAAIDWFA